jgi:hypothetical protein
LLASAPVQADPSDSTSSGWSGFYIEVSLSSWRDLLILFGIIGGGEPTPPPPTESDDGGTVQSFGIIGGGTPPPNGG